MLPANNNLSQLCRLDGRVVFFPVRHHSPAAARLVREAARQLRPRAILIEGPFDFNPHIEQLYLGHRLPIAVFSYLRTPEGLHRSAYHPFCDHSPEWQAVLAAREIQAQVEFIDLPWGDLALGEEAVVNRYADGPLLRGKYLKLICERVRVDDLDTAWDTIFEIPRLDLPTYLQRCHELCSQSRLLEGPGSLYDRRREAFMAARIRASLASHDGQVLVVTGGFHSLALFLRLKGIVSPFTDPGQVEPAPPRDGEERGIALTPYSFERLDALTGYDAGMPNPGFYQEVWRARTEQRGDVYRHLMAQVTKELRQRGQRVSAADLIAADSTARALAALRGHAEVWRSDMVDGLVGALIKDDLSRESRHPLLEVVHAVLRGGERGQLALGTLQPPLVGDIEQRLRQMELHCGREPRSLDLNLETPADRQRSQVLHRLVLLQIDGFKRLGASDVMPSSGGKVVEQWQLFASPDFHARCVEAARYGSSLEEAATACLGEQAQGIERDAGQAAALLVRAAFAGLTRQMVKFQKQLRELIRGDADFFSVAVALRNLLYLFRYDAVLETAGSLEVGSLLRETYGRALWLLEGLGNPTGREKELVAAIAGIRETYERCRTELQLDRDELIECMRRVLTDRAQGAVGRGAVLGVCWSLGDADGAQVLTQMRLFTQPDHLGDFLTGLFSLAREQVQRQPDLILAIHQVLHGWETEEFLAALPALRLAFTRFTPREKHQLATTLRKVLGLSAEQLLAPLEASIETAARVMAWEARLFAALEKFGIRGGKP